MSREKQREELDRSTDMEPVEGTIEVEIPVDELWECFRRASDWPSWNKCFRWVLNRDLVKEKKLVWAFNPIRWWYLYVMPAVADIVEVVPEKRVTWEVRALPGFFARHTYHMEDIGEGWSRFGSWEKAMGWNFRLTKRFWLAHFTYVKERSLAGAQTLEAIYQERGRLGPLEGRKRKAKTAVAGFAVLLFAVLLGAGAWFYFSYVRLSTEELAPGITAIVGGGSNSLVVVGDEEVLLVDTKFPPMSTRLHRWIEKHAGHPVTQIVNTHYHYDHTQGNPLYPGARIYAARGVRDFMLGDDPEYWRDKDGLPNETVADSLTSFLVAGHSITLMRVAQAHTNGDLVVVLPDERIVATGDLLFHTYYPFFDTHPDRGASIPGMIRAIRLLADTYPDARFLPGHGPMATADDLDRYADNLENLVQSVDLAVAEGLTKKETVQRVELAGWDRKILPSLHNSWIPEWATKSRTVADAYELRVNPLIANER